MEAVNTTMDPESNSSVAGSTEPAIHFAQQMSDQIWLRVVFIILYAIIFVVGISGNSLVMFVVTRNKSMQTITNIFITNLALSDILMCLLAVPFTPLTVFMDRWVFGAALCRLVPMALGVCVYVSTLTCMAIAIDRYFVIVHPFKPRMKVSVCFLIITSIWVVSCSVSLPLAIYQTHKLQNGTYVCHEYWPKETARQFFSIASLILQYVIPCSIIIMCYLEVSLKLHSRLKGRSSLGVRSREREEIELRRKRRTNWMLIAMVVIFMCCWLPLNTMHILMEYSFETLLMWPYFELMFTVTHVIAMSSTVYNPFLYAWMNENFRKEFRAVVPCLFFEKNTRTLSTSRYTVVENTAEQGETKTRAETKTLMVGEGGSEGDKERCNGNTGHVASYDVTTNKVLLQDDSKQDGNVN